MQDVYKFNIDDHITQGIGTTFDKVELLQLSEFSVVRDREIVMIPVLEEQKGDYMFVLSVVDSKNN